MPMKYCDVLPGDNGVDVFLLHGYRSKCGKLHLLGETLNKAGYTVVDCEYIGHGGRVGSRHDVYKTMLELERVIRSRKNDVVIVGHSLGGGMALSIAARLDKVKKAFGISAPNGAKFEEKGHFRKIQAMFVERINDADKEVFRKVMPSLYGECKDGNSSKFYLVHSKKDSVVPFSEFEENTRLFCVPKRNTLVYENIYGIGVVDHVKTAYMQETIDFIMKRLRPARK